MKHYIIVIIFDYYELRIYFKYILSLMFFIMIELFINIKIFKMKLNIYF